MFTWSLAVSWQASEYAYHVCGAQMPDFFLRNCFVFYIKDFEGVAWWSGG